MKRGFLARRILAVGLLLAAILNLALRPAVEGEDDPQVLTFGEGTIQDAPYGYVLCEELSTKAPEPWEAQEDLTWRPYHLLVRILAWPDLSPFDVDTGLLTVPGASSPRHVGPGEYMYDRLGAGVTFVHLGDSLYRREAGQKTVLAARNPVPMARHAVTICELIYVSEDERHQPLPLQGVVRDRHTQQPVAFATVTAGGSDKSLNNQAVQTDENGYFIFPQPVTVAELLDLFIVHANYKLFQHSMMNLTGTWVRNFQETGSAEFSLILKDPPDTSSPVHPDYRR
jgi:hypothetical protein